MDPSLLYGCGFSLGAATCWKVIFSQVLVVRASNLSIGQAETGRDKQINVNWRPAGLQNKFYDSKDHTRARARAHTHTHTHTHTHPTTITLGEKEPANREKTS